MGGKGEVGKGDGGARPPPPVAPPHWEPPEGVRFPVGYGLGGGPPLSEVESEAEGVYGFGEYTLGLARDGFGLQLGDETLILSASHPPPPNR